MEILEFLTELIWPTTVIILAFAFKSPFSDLIRILRNFEYKKGKDGHEIKASFFTSTMEDTKKKLEFDDSTDSQTPYISTNPKQAVLDAYKKLEIAAEKKLCELKIDLSEEEYKNSPLQFLIYKGAFSPTIESALQNMRLLRNQVTHYTESEIPKVDAQSYVSVTSKIEKIIGALDRLPAMNLHSITMIVRSLSILLDSEKYGNITIEDVHRHIKDGSILQFIAKFEEAHELRGILKTDLWRGFDRFYTQSLQSIYYGYAGDERRKWGIQNSGICLLLAWTNEIIQMGSGWHPNTNLSELDEAQTQ